MVFAGHDSHRNGFLYAIPMLGMTFLSGSVTIIQGMYAKYFGLEIIVIAQVIFWARIFDAVSDPCVGYLSDRICMRRGSRKVIVVVGGLLFIGCSYFLFVPKFQENGAVSPLYFTTCYLLFYLSQTVFEIPHLTWGSDLARGQGEANIFFGWRTFFFYIGHLLFFLVPLLPVFEAHDFTPETLKWTVYIAGALMCSCLAVSVATVSSGYNSDSFPISTSKKLLPEISLKTVLRLLGRASIYLFYGAVLCVNFGGGMWLGLMFLYADVYLQLGALLPVAMALGYAFGAVSIYAWVRITRWFDNKIAWNIAQAMILSGICLTAILTPGGANSWALVCCTLLVMVGFACVNVVAPALLSAIVEDASGGGSKNAGTFFSLYVFTTKVGGTAGSALGLLIAGVYGFEATAVIQAPGAIMGLKIAMMWVPAAFLLVAMLCIMFHPRALSQPHTCANY